MRGQKVELTTLDVSNSETVRGWLNDPEIHRWMLTGHVPITAAEERRFFETTEDDRAAGGAHRFEIHALDDGRLVGVCGLEHVDPIHRNAEIGIFVAPPDEWGRGFGGDSIQVLMRFAFEVLGLNALWISAFAENERALALYRRLGFRDYGLRRQAYHLNGQFRDLVLLDLLEAEYRAGETTP